MRLLWKIHSGTRFPYDLTVILYKMASATFQLLLAGLCILQAVSAEDWWVNANFYQVYPRSFQDSDGDGIGDLKGISQRLEHFQYLGINGIWLSPVFPSPMKDFGYDITDYRGIHYEYGTLDDFKELLHRCHELNIKLVLDFVPNHSSDQHEWFKASSDPSHPEFEKYKDYYVWHDGARAANGSIVGPPSNWIGIFRYSAWTLHPKRNQYYLHQFLPAQPDLNFRNPAVSAEMVDILRFWYDMGVDGFRIDAIPFIFETKANQSIGRYNDEPKTGWCEPDDYCYLHHTETFNLNETFEEVYLWRKVSDSYTDSTRILMTEAYASLEDTLRYYGGVVNGEEVEGAQIPFNFELLGKTNKESTARDYEKALWGWMNNMPKRAGIHANWVLGNHDQKRFSSRYGPNRTDLFNIFLKTLPGISITYYGEEIGMTDVYISWEDTVDPQACNTNPQVFHQHSRDPARTPLQWSSGHNAGFSAANKTWLPLSKNYTINNVELQKSQPQSHLKVFKTLLELREHPTMRYGDLATNVFGNDTLVYKREMADDPTVDAYYFIMNFGVRNTFVPLSTLLKNVPKELEVVVSSVQSASLIAGKTVYSNSIYTEAEVGAVFVGRKTST